MAIIHVLAQQQQRRSAASARAGGPVTQA